VDLLPSTHRRLAIVITVGALALAAIHVARPQLSIDSVTVILVVLALLPWLAPIIKSITLPGGVELELRDVKEGLSHVAERISEVERVVFSGAVSKSEQEHLEQELRRFSAYLEELSFTPMSPLPTVHVTASDVGSSFDPKTGEILLSKSLARDTEFLFREYTHSVLLTALGPAVESRLTQLPFYQLESGVALYFPSSFKGGPSFGSAEAAAVFGMRATHLATLENDLRLKDVPAADADSGALAAGQVWGGILWQLRADVGRSKADRIVAKVWLTTASGPHRNWASAFSGELLKVVAADQGSAERDAVRANLVRRGLRAAANAG
jgi:hypothetical protein